MESFILHNLKLFRKSLKTVKSSNLGTKSLKVRALVVTYARVLDDVMLM